MKLKMLLDIGGKYKAGEFYDVPDDEVTNLSLESGVHYEEAVEGEAEDAERTKRAAKLRDDMAATIVDRVFDRLEASHAADAAERKAPAFLSKYGRGTDEHEEKFSWARSVRGIVTGKWDQAPIEKNLLEATGAAGGYLVPTEQSMELIGMLREESVVRAAGARVWPMPSDVTTIPIQTAGATTYWEGEVDITTSGMTKDTTIAFGQRQLVAKKLYAYVGMSNDLIADASPSVESIVKDSLVTDIAEAEDLAYLTGAGVGATPSGFNKLVTTNTNSSTVAAGASQLTFDTVLDMMYNVRNKKSKVTAFITHPYVINALRKIATSTGDYIYGTRDPSKPIPAQWYGMPVFESTQCLSGTDYYVVAGNFKREAIVGQRAQIALANSSHVEFDKDVTVIRATIRVDFKLAHEDAFHLETVTAS